jgi:hypothetical protein
MPDYIAKLRLLRNATAAVRSRRARPATVIGDAVQGWRLGFEAGWNWADRPRASNSVLPCSISPTGAISRGSSGGFLPAEPSTSRAIAYQVLGIASTTSHVAGRGAVLCRKSAMSATCAIRQHATADRPAVSREHLRQAARGQRASSFTRS